MRYSLSDTCQSYGLKYDLVTSAKFYSNWSQSL